MNSGGIEIPCPSCGFRTAEKVVDGVRVFVCQAGAACGRTLSEPEALAVRMGRTDPYAAPLRDEIPPSLHDLRQSGAPWAWRRRAGRR